MRYSLVALLVVASAVRADAPVASYIFPAGGQRGTTVKARVGGLNLHSRCDLEFPGSGVAFAKTLKPMPTLWFEGPLLPLPDSQRQEDYPKDMAAELRIAAEAPLGVRYWHLSTSQGVTPAMRFLIGDLPETVEDEIDGDPVPVDVKLPLTINGRVFPRADVDLWRFTAKMGQTITAEVHASRLGSPLDVRFEVLDENHRSIAESENLPGGDARLRFTAPRDGRFLVKIHDVGFQGGPAHVYRLTLTDGPYVDRIFPLGGKRGGRIDAELHGQRVPARISLQAPGGPEPWAWMQADAAGLKSNLFLMDLDDLEERMESTASVTLPAMGNGRIAKAGEVDDWKVALKKGETLEAELRAARLGSPLDGVLSVVDASGKELARADAPPADAVDPMLRFTAAADDVYTIRVQDRFRSRGGPEYAYRLRLTQASAPDFRLRVQTNAVTLVRGAKPVNLPITVERRGGFTGDIVLTVDGLPKGVAAKWKDVAKASATTIQFEVDPETPIQSTRITIRGTAKIGDREVVRVAAAPTVFGQPPIETVLVGVALPTPFKIKGAYDMQWVARGSMLKRKYQIERNGFEGPLVVSLADKQARHLQGVHGPTVVIPAGATEFEYGVHLPPWMEIGRTSRTCVMAVGVVKDKDGREHEVSFSSVNTNDQMVAVVETGKLTVSLDRPAIAVTPGKIVSIPVQVSRGASLTGVVRVEVVVAPHMRGLSADPITLAKDQTQATLKIVCAESLAGPFNMPLLIRASLQGEMGLVTAEARIEAVAE